MRQILLAAMVAGVVAHGQHAGAQTVVSLASFGSAGNDGVTSIASRNGMVAVAGIAGGAMDGQAYAGGTSDGFVRAYDAAGQLLWTRLVGTTQDDTIADVAIDVAGNIYVAGRTGTSPQAGFQQGFVAKLDASGTPIWHQLLGEGLPSALATTPAGQVVVVGYTNGPMSGQAHAGGHDAFIARLDPGGTVLTVRLYGSASEEEFLDVAIDSVTGETYVGGSVQTFAFQIDGLDIVPIGGGDGFVVKFAAAGTADWFVRIAAETLVPDGIRALALRPGGGVVATGFTMGALPAHSMSGLVDAFLVAMSAQGAVDWSHQFGTANGYVDAAGVVIADDGNLFLTGRLSDLSGISRATVWARNSVGDALWTYSIADGGSSALAFSPAGSLIVGGITNEPPPSHHELVPDSGPSERQGEPQSELGGTDAFVAIIDTVTIVDPPPPPPGPTLTVTRTGNGTGVVSSAPSGIECGASCASSFDSGTLVTLIPTADSTSIFTGWSGSCSGSSGCTLTVDGNKTVIATFTRLTSMLTVTRAGTGTGLVISNPAGINCGADCIETFNAGMLVTLSTDASGSSVFSGWSGACTGTGSCVVTMDSAKSVTATFTATTFPLTVTRAGTGAGFVISNPSGISCGSTCVATFPGGTLVTLAHDPSGPSVFSGWSGACSGTGACVVAMDAAKSVTATFTATAYPLTVTRVGTGTGLVISNPTGINCGADCVETYNGGTIVTLAVDASGTSTFAGWSGACTGMAACAVTMTAARSVAATFMLPVVVPAISIVDIRIGEGSAGVATVLIPVTLDRPTSVTVKIAFAILPATADATDVRLDKGTVTFEPGQTTQQIVAFVNGDKLVEPKETFTVSLDSAVNATILKGSATITIVDDDIDTIAPEIGAKTAVVVEVKMASTGTVAVTYAAPEAKDGRDGAVPVVCAPASGTKLPYGTTPVTCLAEDKAGNLSSISFQIVVRLPTVAGAIFDKSSPAAPLTEVHAAQHVLVRVNAGAFAPRAKVTLSFLDASGREFHLRAGHAAADGSLDLDAVIPEKAALGGGQVFAASGSDADYDRAWLVTVTPPQR